MAAALGLALLPRPAPPLADLGALPPFSLQERSGRTVRLDDLRGQVWVADFIFTRCAGTCPAMTARLVRLRKEVPPEILFVSFTVDPRHDTPEVLARYARDFGADERWLFLTGSQDALYRLATEGFKLAALAVPPEQQRTGGDGPFLHSSKFVLLDGGGRVRGYYDSEDETAMAQLIRDVKRIARLAG